MSPEKLAIGGEERQQSVGSREAFIVFSIGDLRTYSETKRKNSQKRLKYKRGENAEEELPEEVGYPGQLTRDRGTSVSASPTFPLGCRVWYSGA